MQNKTNKTRTLRALDVQLLEARNLFAGVVAPLAHTSDVGPSFDPTHHNSAAYDPTGDVAYAHEMLGLTGAGQTVAIIDSGIAYDHYALGGGFGEGQRVVGGWDFAENDADPYDDGPLGYHGTHIAGIVGSDDLQNRGVAPGADLVALRVFDDFGDSDFDWIEAALAWVHNHKDSFENPITAVNLSIGAGLNGETVPDWTELEDEFEDLANDGIFVAVAAGNGFREYGIAGLNYPAASPYVIPVSSVSPAGELSDFSQRHERSLSAPGELVYSTVPDYLYGFDGVTDDFAKSSGTSMATPYVAGAGVLVQEALARVGREDVTPSEVYEQLYDHADAVYDATTGADYKRVDLRATLDAILGTNQGELPSSETPLGEPNGSASESPLNEAISVTSLGNVDATTLLAATDRWFEFQAAQSGVMMASNLAADVAVYQGGVRIDQAAKAPLHDATRDSRFFNVIAGETLRIHVPASNEETTLQQLLAFDGSEIVVRGDREADDLYVSLGPAFVAAAHGVQHRVDTGGRLVGDQLFGKQLSGIDVEQTRHGIVIRLETETSKSQTPSASAIAVADERAAHGNHATSSADENAARAPRHTPTTSSISVGCGIQNSLESLLSEHAADTMFAGIDTARTESAAVLPARLLDELYSERNLATTVSRVELPPALSAQADLGPVDHALSSRLNRF